jgi:hypothetical protein
MENYLFRDQTEENWKEIFANVYNNNYRNIEFPEELNSLILIVKKLPSQNDRHIYFDPDNNNYFISLMNKFNKSFLVFYKFIHCNNVHYRFINCARVENYSSKHKTYKLAFIYLTDNNKINILKNQLK